MNRLGSCLGVKIARLRDKLNSVEEGKRGVKDGTQVGDLSFSSTWSWKRQELHTEYKDRIVTVSQAGQ